jgi:phenylalanyl-tRNA synthetase beta chain
VADLSGRNLELAQEAVPGLHPGRAGRLLLGGVEVGCLGQLHPDEAGRLDIPGAAVLAEINFDEVAGRSLDPKFEPYSRYPAMARDLAITVAVTTPASDAISAIAELGEVILRSVELFDEYHGGQLEAGRKGLTLHLVFQAADRTLRGQEVAAAEKRIVEQLQHRLDARLRD